MNISYDYYKIQKHIKGGGGTSRKSVQPVTDAQKSGTATRLFAVSADAHGYEADKRGRNAVFARTGCI